MLTVYRFLPVVAAGIATLSSVALSAQASSMRVTVPSPTAASLGKPVDVPVNPHTGVPDISIPLFTVKGKTLELPIALRYHAGGIRVEEIGGWAGLGWSLDAGGTITRTVRGLADDEAGGYWGTGHALYNSANWPNPGFAFVENIMNGGIDTEPDRFFFSTGQRSGQFVMGPTSTSAGVLKARTTPHQRLKIEPTVGLAGATQWKITTEDGTRYTFAAAETSTDYSDIVMSGGGPINQNFGQTHKSSWHLTEVRSPGGDVINLYYSAHTVRHRPSRYHEKFDQVSGSCGLSSYQVISEFEIAAQRLDSIKSAEHTVRFSSTLRTDALSPTNQQQEYRLDRVTVTTPTGIEVRRFQFEHDYFAGNRLRLKSVAEQDGSGVSLPPHTFTYNGQTLPSRTSFSQDHWGYYNGISNSTLIPAMPGLGGVPLSGGDRSPSASHMQVGVLTRITYPTGGSDSFVFEANDYGGVGANSAPPIGTGPLQSVVASSYSGDGPVSKPINVGGTETITATVWVDKDPAGCETQFFPPCPIAEIDGSGTNLTDGVHQIALAPGSHTLEVSDNGSGGYVVVTVQWRDAGPLKKKTAGGLRIAEVRSANAMGDSTTRRYRYTLQSDTMRSSGRVIAEPAYGYYYSDPSCLYFSRSSMSRMPLGEGPIVGYGEVTVFHGANGQHGTTRYSYRSPLHANDADLPSSWPYSPRTSYEWKRGQQTSASEYNASGQLQRRTASAHQFRESAPDSAVRFRALSINVFSAGMFGGTYLYHPFEIISAWGHPSADTTFTYNESGGNGFSNVTAFTYGNPAHLQATQTTETNSSGTQRIIRTKYPADYASGSGNVEAIALTAMKGSAHIH
jgi:hypothetical protein